MLKMISR